MDQSPPACTGAKAAATASAAISESDWKKDAPGRAHKIDLSALPAPFATPSARNNPKLVPRPPYAELSVPKGFKVGMFAKDLQGPRKIVVTPGGDLFVTETRGGRVSVLHPAPDGRSSVSATCLRTDSTSRSALRSIPARRIRSGCTSLKPTASCALPSREVT